MKKTLQPYRLAVLISVLFWLVMIWAFPAHAYDATMCNLGYDIYCDMPKPDALTQQLQQYQLQEQLRKQQYQNDLQQFRQLEFNNQQFLLQQQQQFNQQMQQQQLLDQLRRDNR